VKDSIKKMSKVFWTKLGILDNEAIQAAEKSPGCFYVACSYD
jgi:hypothetical protein